MATATLHDEVGSKAKGKPGAGDRIQCLVVTPERAVLDEQVDFVALPLFDGELGILPGHTPLIGRLGEGELRTRQGGVEHRYYIDGGFVQVRDDVVTVLTQRAVPQAEIDAQAASDELAKVQAGRATSEEQLQQKERAVRRARAMLRVASRRG